MKNILKILVVIGIISTGLYASANVYPVVDVLTPRLTVTDVTSTSAKIVSDTSFYGDMMIEYGVSPNLGSYALNDPSVDNPQSRNFVIINNLQPSTTYSYRLIWSGHACNVAPCPNALPQQGPTYTFKTLDITNTYIDVTKATLSVSNITYTSAQITANISFLKANNPFYIEYGTSGSFGSSVQVNEIYTFTNSSLYMPTATAVAIPSGTSKADLSNLKPNTTYYYRLTEDRNHCIQSRYTEIPCLATVNPSSDTYSFNTRSTNFADPVGMTITKTLRYGMRDAQVKILQRSLGLKEDGYFGSGTKKAVIKFQQQHVLKADGIVGQWTISTLFVRASSDEGILPILLSCLPAGIALSDIVEAPEMETRNYVSTITKPSVSVGQKLNALKASCSNSQLVDGSMRPITFYHLTGCWGNPPQDAQGIMIKQQNEINDLKVNNTVIEMTCNPSGLPRY